MIPKSVQRFSDKIMRKRKTLTRMSPEMTVRPPRQLATKIWTDNPAAALDYEIAQEKASALGRLGRGLESALDALRDFDARQNRDARQNGDAAREQRRVLVAQAGHALWLFVVQRESVGLRGTRQLMRDYGVPGEVQACMGMLPAKAAR
jgi:hypothetical protein